MNYETELKNLKEAQRKSAVADLENTRNQALSNLEAERQSNLAGYNTARNVANAQNKMSSRNFQEYLASTGRANTGLAGQARLQSSANLGNALSNIRANQLGTEADINRRRTLANDTYNTGLAGANANIEANYIQNLLSQRQQQQQMDYQKERDRIANDLAERQFQESVRQFNEQMALNRAKMYGSFSSGGSSGGKRASSAKSKTSGTTLTGTTNSGGSSFLSNAANNIKSKLTNTKALNDLAKNPQDNAVVIELQGRNGLTNALGYESGGHVYYKDGNQWKLYR